MDTTGVKAFNTLGTEIEQVSQFLANEEFRYDGKLSTTLYVDSQVDREIVVPKRLIHAFVINALNHGIFHNGAKGHIDISVNKSSIGILIMIADNGNGQSTGGSVRTHKSEEIRLLDSYLPLFNRQQDHKVSYEIVDLEHSKPGDTGTRVLITLAN